MSYIENYLRLNKKLRCYKFMLTDDCDAINKIDFNHECIETIN